MNKFRQYFAILFFCLLYSALFADNDELVFASFRFMSQEVSLEYDPEMLFQEDVCMKNKCFKNFYKRMKKMPYQPFVEDLQRHQKNLKLNDWSLYRLVDRAVKEIVGGNESLHRGLITWFLLNEMGYDIRIAVTKKGNPFIYAYAEETMGNVPSFKDGEKVFVNLTSINLQMDSRKMDLYISDFIANEKGKGFQFTLDILPELPPKVVEKKITFTFRNQQYHWTIKVDSAYAELLRTYPEMSDMGYIIAPLSTTLKESLYPQFKILIEGKSARDALEVLVAFTRSAFAYQSDWTLYHQNQAMYAEQLFFSEFSDQEDRTALLYNLIKDLLDLPMLVLSGHNNMTLGVEWFEKADRTFQYDGRRYLICDPTLPFSSSKIGEFPIGLNQKTARILWIYK